MSACTRHSLCILKDLCLGYSKLSIHWHHICSVVALPLECRFKLLVTTITLSSKFVNLLLQFCVLVVYEH